MSLSIKYALLFAVLGLGGTIYLRGYALGFMYNQMDRFWSGIASTIISYLVLALIVGIVVTFYLSRYEATLKKAKKGIPIPEAERKKALAEIGRAHV